MFVQGSATWACIVCTLKLHCLSTEKNNNKKVLDLGSLRMLSFLGSPSWKACPDKHVYRKWSVIFSNNDNLIWWRSNTFSCMNSFDSVLLCNDITSWYGMEQNRTREQQHSRYVLIRIQAKQQHGRFCLVQIQWNCTFNTPKKMSLKNWKYLKERMQPKAMFIDNR